jgi:ribosome-binding protein aMBF1 (putative translation factor)
VTESECKIFGMANATVDGRGILMNKLQDILNFGKRLKELRMSKGLSLEEISMKTGVSDSMYLQWEEGHWVLDETHYSRLSDSLDVSTRFLIFGSEDQMVG